MPAASSSRRSGDRNLRSNSSKRNERGFPGSVPMAGLAKGSGRNLQPSKRWDGFATARLVASFALAPFRGPRADAGTGTCGACVFGAGFISMTREELLQRIWIDPGRCSGKPCIRGHRIWVSLILDLLAAGESVEAILEDYPGISREDVQACIAYGSEMARERFVEIPLEPVGA